MVWQAAIPAVASLASAAFGSSEAKKARRAANAIEMRRLGLATRLQDRFFDQFAPVQDRALALASRPINPEVEAAAAGADVERQAGIQRDVGLRQLARYGVSPDSGAAVDSTFRLGLGAALGRAAAMTSARRGARREELGNLLAVSDMGAPLLGQASAGLADIGAARNRRADIADDVAGQAWAGAGQGVADLVSYFANRPRLPAAAAGGSSAPPSRMVPY